MPDVVREARAAPGIMGSLLIGALAAATAGRRMQPLAESAGSYLKKFDPPN